MPYWGGYYGILPVAIWIVNLRTLDFTESSDQYQHWHSQLLREWNGISNDKSCRFIWTATCSNCIDLGLKIQSHGPYKYYIRHHSNSKVTVIILSHFLRRMSKSQNKGTKNLYILESKNFLILSKFCGWIYNDKGQAFQKKM